ncbi:MAG: InlB B-repeat-containing protein [Clostridia bacterium]|nr:InlB B-repeat-containing protein [Clostridia bacterium]
MKSGKKVLSVVLCMIMILGSVAVGGDGIADALASVIEAISVKASAADYKVGDIIEFGLYPQTDVTDSMGSVLNTLDGEWKSYGYYSGSGGLGSEGSMISSDYMRYRDVSYLGEKYRAVIFDKERPWTTTDEATSYNETYQNQNNYFSGNTYWFIYEPIKWRILDPSVGLVLCESIIDSQAFNDLVYRGLNDYFSDSELQNYASDYATSSIRNWLNEVFIKTAFTDDQITNILLTPLQNYGYGTITGDEKYKKYDSNNTADKIFLLSYNEVLSEAYGFENNYNKTESRKAFGSDYAKSQGLYVYHSLFSEYDGCSNWWLRTPGRFSTESCAVWEDGEIFDGHQANTIWEGVRPALRLKELKSDYTSDANPDGLRVIINNTDLIYYEGEDIVMAVSGFKDGNEILPANLTVKSSDDSVVSVEHIYDFDTLPAKFEKLEEFKNSRIILAKAKTSGTAVISLTDSAAHSSRRIPLGVVKDTSGRFRFNDISTLKYKWADDYYNGCTDNIWISDFSYGSGKDGWNISMNLYNENYCPGVIEVYDANGKLYDVREIEKHENSEDTVDLFKAGWALIKDIVDGKALSFRAASSAKHTPIKDLFVPQDGYFIVTADSTKSKCCAVVNGIDLMFELWSVAKDFKSIISGVDSLSADNIQDIKGKVFLKLLASEEYLHYAEKFQENFAKKVSQSFLKSALESCAGGITLDVENFLEDIGSSIDKLLKSVVGTGVSIAEDLFTKCSGPAGVAINALYFSNKVENIILQRFDAEKNMTGNNLWGAFTPYKHNQGILKSENVEVHSQNNVPSEAVLQSYKIASGDTGDFDLGSGKLLNRDYKQYDISLWNHGKEIQPDGEVIVYIDSPYKQAAVAKMDENGHWIHVDSKMENGKVKFSVNHFCKFAVIDYREAKDLEHTATFISDGKTISEKKYKEGDTIVIPGNPSKAGYTFSGWTPVPDKMPAKDMTFNAVFIKNPVPAAPDISIKNYKPTLSVDYKSKLIFHTAKEAPAGYEIVWQDGTKGSSFTINQATKNEYKIQASLVKDGKVVASSEAETVTVNTGFFARLIAFFLSLFGSLPEYVDNEK